MKQYYCQYVVGGNWISFSMLARSIYEAVEWMHENIQRKGICVTLVDLTAEL